MKSNIIKEHYLLNCGELLRVGDCFTRLGSNGSAGNQPIILTPPWVQRYQGKLLLEDFVYGYSHNSIGKYLLLFDAINLDSTTEKFVTVRKEKGSWGVKDNYFISYLEFNDGMLFHVKKSGSSTVCKCDVIDRVGNINN